MANTLAEKYAGPVPRYTSYPTAPHFHDGVESDTYRQWLADVPLNESLSLYVHIPFCDSLCWFCGCQTKVVNRYGPISAYLALLHTEIDRVAAILGATRPVGHIHWGGGTPTMLSSGDIVALSDHLRARFDVLDSAVFAVEIDPRILDRDRVSALASAGVNRASLGVQDIDPQVQEAVNRHQPFAATKQAVDWLRDAGIDDLNIDLMYGLPHQTTERIAATVETVVTLRPNRIALFGYAHVPWMKRHQCLIDEAALPDAAERERQSTAAARHLKESGYRQIGLDHFARPDEPLWRALETGRLRRNFQGYTTDEAETLLGFGVSAIGALPQGYVQNLPDLRDYRRAIENGDLPVARGVALSDDDRLRRAIIERLMCNLKVDLDSLCRPFGRDWRQFGDELARLAPMVEDGLVAIDGDSVRVTEAGRPLMRSVCAVFDAYLGGGGRHSIAV